jgi:hypothetical protein
LSTSVVVVEECILDFVKSVVLYFEF